MTISSVASESGSRPWSVCGVAGWLALAASPTFALTAGIAASNAPVAALCTSPGLLPVDGMTAMYLLMSIFHLAPWLKLARRRPRGRI